MWTLSSQLQNKGLNNYSTSVYSNTAYYHPINVKRVDLCCFFNACSGAKLTKLMRASNVYVQLLLR